MFSVYIIPSFVMDKFKSDYKSPKLPSSTAITSKLKKFLEKCLPYDYLENHKRTQRSATGI